MADDNYRSFRSRDSLVRNDVKTPAAEDADPLAELARLIGQTDPHGEPGSHGGDAADDRYADQRNTPQDRYVQQPPLPSSLSDSYPSRAPQRSGREQDALPTGRYFSGPAAKFSGFREGDGHYVAADDPQYRQEPLPELPEELSTAAVPGYGYRVDDREQSEQPYLSDEYHEKAPRARRGGLVVVMAVLALAVVGTAGAFAYRTVFGGSVLSALPPIIKASNGPNKILSSRGDAQTNSPAGGAASAGSSEKLVSREEQPVQMEAPKTAPGSPAPIQPGQNAPAPSAPVAPVAPVAPTAGPAAPAAPPPAAAAVQPPPAPPPVAAPVSSEPKKVHTVTIHADQPNNPGAVPLPSPPASRGAARPASTAAKPSANAPLAILPGADADGAAPTGARARAVAASTATGAPMAVASATPGGAAEARSAGGYAVQLTSQRSEAEAQAAFRSLQAKYPDQLGGREPIVRRVDLGAKGVYYRALVGPFASMEEAASMCSNLKAAGGTCIVQKN